MENLVEARCAVLGCGHLMSDHVILAGNYHEKNSQWCYACDGDTWLHDFVLAHAHPIVDHQPIPVHCKGEEK